jgi:FKBP-type peptidyl-prolyl cis-trans isomerase FkpA
MKKLIGAVFLVFALGGLLYAEGKKDEAAEATVDGDTSYAFGMVIGSELQQTGLIFNYNAFTKGLREVLENKNTKITMDEAVLTVQQAFLEVMRKRAEENKAKELRFLEENGKKPGVNTTVSGLQYEVITEGTGPKPAAEDIVRVNYEGTLIDGTVFDSTYTRGEPAEFPLYAVIAGWTEGLQLMSEGSSYRFYIPSKLAYGEQGAGSVIPPYSTLIFEVELLSISKELEKTDEEADTTTEDGDEEDTPI